MRTFRSALLGRPKGLHYTGLEACAPREPVLIVAIPKSSSSSLIATLCRAHGLPNATFSTRRRFFPHLSAAAGYPQMAHFHSDVVEVDEAVAQAVAGKDQFSRHHFPPTPGNLARLAAIPKVVLLRDAFDIVRAYKRGDETGAFELQSHEFCFCFSERSWLDRARATGLLSELQAYADGWRAHDGDKLILDYSELIREPGRALDRVERYFHLSPSGESTLARERYSRAPTARTPNALSLLVSRRRLLLRRLLSGGSKLLLGDTAVYDKVKAAHRRRIWARSDR